MDIAVGEYLFGWLTAQALLAGSLLPGNAVIPVLLSAVEVVLAMVLVYQLVYYAMFGGCFDAVGARVMRETHVNEIIEYMKTGKTFFLPVLYLLLFVAATAAVVWMNISATPMTGALAWWRNLLLILYFAAVSRLLWGPHKGAVRRAGPVRLMLDEIEYARSNRVYLTERDRRLRDLTVRRLDRRTDSRPQTVVMVIGESASRDYMSAFAPQPGGIDTTPWMSREARDRDRFILFPNSYSCAFQTVPTLERALTEKNQYNELEFNSSVSIIDIAHALGYRVHWYSNQGHLGSFDTPVTLVAETSDVAKWTNQQVGKVQYDSVLLDFFSEVDPGRDNFVVFHLKGSHFNFFNRYPADQAVWGGPGCEDPQTTYRNSIRYTDTILEQIFDYARKNLNLQAMVYFSDHATIPDRRRSPRFDGFGQCRIPLAVWLSDNYCNEHPGRAAALRHNRDRYFTNDLTYDLLCGIFDIESNHFDPTQSLARDEYRFTRDKLTTYLGTRRIADDRS
ncbi:MAG: phosphoethanolamine transferase [Clostridium sp.]|nr:phosphoethanolamine transferase [Clostridium sp.]